MNKQPIGVYDSGIGGITVLKELVAKMPHEDFIYFGDTANLPYGNKTPAQIIEFSRRIIEWFMTRMNAKAVVAACHTSSALALPHFESELGQKVFGTIKPLINTILSSSVSNIAIFATEASAKSKVHETILRNRGFTGQITSVGCPDYVPLIEAGDLSSKDIIEATKKYLQFLPERPDALLFGCTHYPLIRPAFESILPLETQYFDPAEAIAHDLATYLNQNLLTTASSGSISFFCSGPTQPFEEKIKAISGFIPHTVQQVCLDQVEWTQSKFA